MPRLTSFVACFAALIPLVACSESTPPPATVASAPSLVPTRIELPVQVTFPEGVAYDAASGALYTGGAADGLLVRVNATTGAVDVVKPASTLVPAGDTTFPVVLGMETDGRNRLWVSGGRTGKMWVVSTADGTVIKEATVPTAGKSLINDVALVGNAAYFTDTFVPTLWRMSIEGDTVGDPEAWVDLSGTPIVYGEGANLNGITATPDGRTLIVVHMGQGLLFKVDVATRAVTPIDVAGADLSGADGLVLDGSTLYVVRQTAVEIATVRLNADLTSGSVVSRFTEGLAWPATAVKVGDDLIVVNTQFNTRADNTTVRPFNLLRVPLARLSGQ